MTVFDGRAPGSAVEGSAVGGSAVGGSAVTGSAVTSSARSRSFVAIPVDEKQVTPNHSCTPERLRP